MTTVTHETELYEGEPPTPDLARKIAHIERLAQDEEREGFGRVGCSCRSSWEDTGTPPTTEELRARAVYLVKFPDPHTMAEHRRRVNMAILRADPGYEPPEEWAGGLLLEQVRLERASLAKDCKEAR